MASAITVFLSMALHVGVISLMVYMLVYVSAYVCVGVVVGGGGITRHNPCYIKSQIDRKQTPL